MLNGWFQQIRTNPKEKFISAFEIFLETETSEVQNCAARAVQYSCITVLFQLVGYGFRHQHYDLKQVINENVAELEEQRLVKVSNWRFVLPHYKAIFDFAFSDSERNLKERLWYQGKFGCFLYGKYLMLLGERNKLSLQAKAEPYNYRDLTNFPEKFQRQVRSCLNCTIVTFLYSQHLFSSVSYKQNMLIVCAMWRS